MQLSPEHVDAGVEAADLRIVGEKQAQELAFGQVGGAHAFDHRRLGRDTLTAGPPQNR